MNVVILLTLLAQSPAAAPPPAAEPFKIVDNSFLVEEAFNQEPRIVQNIVNWSRQNDAWLLTYTQEWPVPGVRHQLSYTLPFDSSGVGDLLVNYRLQVYEEGPGRPAFAPRLSAILPSGRGPSSPGIQTNLPFSKQRGDWYFHGNAGITWLRSPEHVWLETPAVAGSAIYRAAPMVNLMLESVLSFDQRVTATPRTGSQEGPLVTRERTGTFTISPGIRGGWNLDPETQIIIGLAIPVSWSEGTTSAGVFGYFSYELPFKR
ncbi:MAG TPA: hypothetical protein VL484_11855 [Vicinamibacterales bacterium]|nr:hypothetical protein [Vicinamibacterales bacterium]